MRRSTSSSRRGRRVTFEALQTRELMAFDSASFIHEGFSSPPALSSEQFATRILDGYENLQWHIPNQPLEDLKKFASETDAKKYLTDAFLKAWQGVLGKSVNNQLFQAYPNNLLDYMEPTSFHSSGGLASLTQTQTLRNSTNNQVQNVDEADQFEVSSDGYVYTTVSGVFGELQQVAVFDARDPMNLRKVASIDVKGLNAQIHLAGEQLILLTSEAHMDDGTGVTRIQVHNVAEPSNPILQSNFTVTGDLQQSRFADGKLTLFRSNFISALRPLFISNDPNAAFQMLPETAVGRFETAEEFAARVQPLVVGWMLPDVKVEGSDVDLNDADWSDLVAAPNSGYRHQVSILAFGLNQSGLELIDSEVLMGATMETSYVDSNTVYLTQTTSSPQSQGSVITNQTAIYAVDYSTDEVAFMAYGTIPGTVRDSRMMDEYQGNLRVFSDVRIWNTSAPEITASSDLYILRPNVGQLEIIGQLTDVADGQSLYSAYFDDAQAMITTWVAEIPNQVTFFPDDPLHAFDLSDPAKPIELSELVIPGVSTYLQRIDNTHLVDGTSYVGTLYVTTYPTSVPVHPVDPVVETVNVVATVMVVDDKGEAVNALKQGEEYWIEVQVADGRVNPQGVFSAYVDVQFDTSALLVVGNVEGIGSFQNRLRAQVSDNLIASLGALGNSLTPSNEGSSRVARIRVRAQKDGTTHLSANQSQGPGEETLLFGLNNVVEDVSIFTPFFGASIKTVAPTGLAPTTRELYGDLSGDGEVSPIDFLLMVEHLNLQSERIKTGANLVALADPVSIMDLSGDGEISPMDMMMLVNQLVLLQSGSAANGEELPAAPTAAQASASDDALMSMLAPRYEDQEDMLLRSQRTMALA